MTEIHLILAGVELGPYSEEQVRRYLAEGLVRPSDHARLAGVDEWSPLEELLARLPPPAPRPEPVPGPLDAWELAFEPTPLPAVEPSPETEVDPPSPPSEPTPVKTEAIQGRTTRNIAKARKRLIAPNPKAPAHVPLANWQSPQLPLEENTVPSEAALKVTPPAVESTPEPPPTQPSAMAVEEIPPEPPPIGLPAREVSPETTNAPLPQAPTQSPSPEEPTPSAIPSPGTQVIKITRREPLSVTGAARRKQQGEDPKKGATAALEALRAASPSPKTEVQSTEPATVILRTKPLETPQKKPEPVPQKMESKVDDPVAPPAPTPTPETPKDTPTPPTSSITATIGKLLQKKIAPKITAPEPEKAEPKWVDPSAPTVGKISPEQSVKALLPADRPPVKLSDMAKKTPEPETVTPPPAETKSSATPAPKPEASAVKPKPKTQRLVFTGEEPLEENKPAAAAGKLVAPTRPLSEVPSRPAAESKAKLKPFSHPKTGRRPPLPSRRTTLKWIYLAGAVALGLLVVFVLYYLVSPSGAQAPVSVVSQDDTAGKSPAAQPTPDAGPRTLSDFYKRGLERQAKGDLDGALADFDQALMIDPRNTGAYSYRGFVNQARGDMDAAVADYGHSLELNPKNAIAYYNRGLIKSQRGDRDGAIADFNQALMVNPKLAVAYYNRGLVKNQKNDLDGAITDFSQALDFNPKLAGAYYNRGLANQAKGELEPALNDYNQALGLDPNIAIAYYYRGLIKEQQADLDGAIVDYDQALVLDPKNDEAYYNRGLAKQARGDLDGSLKDLEKFCDSAPLSPYADYGRLYIWLVNSLQHEGKYADQELADSLRKQWNSSSSDFVTKIAAFLVGTMNETDFLAAAASSDPKKNQGQQCEAWYFAGMKRLMAQDRDTAIDYLNKCVATEERDYCEYISAQAELKRLQAVK